MPLDLAGFALLATLLVLAPGQDTFLVLRNAARDGAQSGVRTTAGICSGLFLHASLSALGLSALLAGSARAFALLRWAGAAYLVWLGLGALRAAWRPGGDPLAERTPRRGPDFAQGFLSNALNVKTATFYLALLPQFALVPERVLADSLLLGAVHAVITFAWLGGVSVLADRARHWLARPGARRALEAGAGAAFLAFGARLALSER